MLYKSLGKIVSVDNNVGTIDVIPPLREGLMMFGMSLIKYGVMHHTVSGGGKYSDR